MEKLFKFYLNEWSLTLAEPPFTSQEGLVAFVKDQNHRPRVLKIFRNKLPKLEANPRLSFLQHFKGSLCPSLYKYDEHAMLQERILPGHSLKERTQQGRDAEVSRSIANILLQIKAAKDLSWPPCTPKIFDFNKAFEKALDFSSHIIPADHVTQGAQIFDKLCQTQGPQVLLHGDLHHDNVLQGKEDKWWVIDPKGVVGEIAYEVGAFLRNPIEDLSLILEDSILQSRLKIISSKLKISPKRLLAHGYSQAILASLWAEEDGQLDLSEKFLRVAKFLWPNQKDNTDF